MALPGARILSRLRGGLLSAVDRAGLAAALGRSAWRARRLFILCYHGVSTLDEHEWDGDLYISQARLRERLALLRALDAAILPLDEAVRRLGEGTLPPRAVALTFDDGAADFASRAVPVLREFGAPATVYVTTHYTHHRLPVFNPALRYVLWRGRASGADLAPLIGAPGPLRPWPRPVMMETARQIREHVIASGAGTRERHQWLERIGAAVGVDVAEVTASGRLALMTPDEVRALPRDLVDVQLHTHRHQTPRDEASFRREIEDNRADLAAMGWPAGARTHFCYPSGDYSARFLPWLRALGVASATTCVPGLAGPGDDPLLLPRLIDAMSTSEATFRAWVLGTAAFAPRGRAFRTDVARA